MQIWLKQINLPELEKVLNENQMKFKSMRQLAEVIDAGTLKSAGLDE